MKIRNYKAIGSETKIVHRLIEFTRQLNLIKYFHVQSKQFKQLKV
jgi:hypothetical protein